MNMLPPAIATFSAILKREGHEVQIFDTTYYAVDHGINSDGSKEEKLNVVPFTKEMEKRNLRKERVGVVTSNKMQKSIVVSEIKKVKHPMYGKFVLKTKKYVAHDETNDCNEGDTVRIMETRPMSKSKCWRLVEIIERAK